MGKDTFYFSHDYNARADDKIKQMLRVHGMLGYGVFWSIVEDLYNNANALPLDYEGIAFDLRVNTNVVKSIINDFNLFSIETDIFGSCSVERRLEERNKKSETARQTAFKRWDKIKEDAKAMPMQCKGNAIKERKGKEKEENTVPKKIDLDELLIKKLDIVPDFQKTFLRWLKYKRQRRESYKTEESTFLAYKKLYKFSEGDLHKAKEIIEHSMSNNYAGFFELKENNQKFQRTFKCPENWIFGVDYAEGKQGCRDCEEFHSNIHNACVSKFQLKK